RKSSASCTCESASVSFWQTRQRSCLVRFFMRASIAGSSIGCATWAAIAPARQKAANTANTKRLLIVQLLRQRHDALAPDIFSNWANLFEPNHPSLVDQKTFGRAVHAVIDRDASIVIVNR